jgi:Trk K+ transport system NAD-binding subunit
MSIPSRIVEKQPDRIRDTAHYVEGDAADIAVLKRAGIEGAPSVVVTTHDDDVNVYLTNYCRRLRADAQIIARARLDRNVSTLHRAGADFVLSYASTGANAIWNMLSADNTLQVAEGLDVFRVPVPRKLAGKPLTQARIREETGCTVVASVSGGDFEPNPDPTVPLPAEGQLVLVGDSESEHRFLSRYRTSPL